MVFFLYLITVVFSLLALVTLPLSLAAFASLNPAAPNVLLLLEVVEGQVSRLVHLMQLGGFTRGMVYVLVGVVCTAVAVWSKPRR